MNWISFLQEPNHQLLEDYPASSFTSSAFIWIHILVKIFKLKSFIILDVFAMIQESLNVNRLLTWLQTTKVYNFFHFSSEGSIFMTFNDRLKEFFHQIRVKISHLISDIFLLMMKFFLLISRSMNYSFMIII